MAAIHSYLFITVKIVILDSHNYEDNAMWQVRGNNDIANTRLQG